MQNPNLSTRFDKGLELATLALTPFPGEVFGVCVCVCGGGGGPLLNKVNPSAFSLLTE